jgi:hypothetical protein
MHRTARGRSGPCTHDEAHSLCVWEGKKTVPDRVASSSWLPARRPAGPLPAGGAFKHGHHSIDGRPDRWTRPAVATQARDSVCPLLLAYPFELVDKRDWIQDHFPAARAHRHGFVAADGRAGVWSTGRSPGFSNDSCLGTICCNNLSVHPASCCFSIRSPAALLVPAHSLSVRTDIPLFGPHPALQVKQSKVCRGAYSEKHDDVYVESTVAVAKRQRAIMQYYSVSLVA